LELGIVAGKSFVTMHWRRGDQLQLRCNKTTTFKHIIFDTSLNCHSVQEFINVTQALLYRENISASVIVSTNEESYEQHMQLHEAGYRTISSLKFKSINLALNTLDLFMLDLVAMMESKWLFEWGSSGVHDFMNDYLGRNKIPDKVTYLDNNLHT